MRDYAALLDITLPRRITSQDLNVPRYFIRSQFAAWRNQTGFYVALPRYGTASCRVNLRILHLLLRGTWTELVVVYDLHPLDSKLPVPQ